ncbi:RsmD family RNA methyltransferase, partial [Blastomonas sp.]|uniref:class I SAM-dependent rRNA methyltransferase n=1 Tax=Blastomonas sp. TaxID=1909299 RepID=UPI00338FC06C
MQHGQKTGWFFDQQDNRDRLRKLVPGMRVLDVFSYVGAWGIRAAGFGASEVTCVDASGPACEQIRDNARRNGFGDTVEAVCADAFEYLKQARAERRKWDVVILDPPAFVKRRKDFKEGALAYRRINEMAMQVLERDGVLVSASCSYHMGRDALQCIQAGALAGSAGQLAAQGQFGVLLRQLQQAGTIGAHLQLEFDATPSDLTQHALDQILVRHLVTQHDFLRRALLQVVLGQEGAQHFGSVLGAVELREEAAAAEVAAVAETQQKHAGAAALQRAGQHVELG